MPWWLWPNVLALDAPTVAVIWQRFLADAFEVAVPVAASLVLGLVVWGIYLFDRMLDGVRSGQTQHRHRFAARHSKLVTTVAGLAFLVAGLLTPLLPWPYLLAGGITAVLVAAYLAVIHLAGVPHVGGKECLVGVLFATGVGIPLIASSVSPSAWLPALVGFGFACWFNCRLIDECEQMRHPSSTRDWYLGFAITGCALFSPLTVAVALVLANGLLLVLHFAQTRHGNTINALADVALLTPSAVWLVS
ncbi:MAG: hypothetical protein C0467_15945 [Planctomycetaceae bacterium]|nr:hypothetical protein [Planctomycetaceae bacterium]